MGHPVIEALLRESMGLDVASVGDASIERALRDRMAAKKLGDAGSYAQLVAESPTEMQELIEAVVVPETWFFRNPEAFRALAALATGEWLPSHPQGALRVLSFPCSTGEEPYSIAMSLMEAGLPRDRFAVDGFDISNQALGKAANAIYGRNSFRSAELAFRERYFHQEKGQFALIDDVRNSVTFAQRNVVEEDFARRPGEYDMIFCRNVLIYFDQLTQQRVLRNLAAALRVNGVLFVGPAESFQVALAGFSSMPQPQAFAFRKAERPNFDVPPASLRPVRTAAAPRKDRPADGGRPKPRASVPSAGARSGFQYGSAPAPLERAEDDVMLARRLADSGDLASALALAERGLTTSAPTAEAYHVLGVIQDAMGDSAAAMQSYRKALYLEPVHLDALVHLAFLLERKGDLGAAQRFRERARRIEERQRA
jgi:chemotaxis protein methyltransferase WspC